MANVLGPKEMNDTCRKTTHMGTTHRDFTVDVTVVLRNAFNIQTINYKVQRKHSAI
jgi:hypothetical protein